jgi:hypothetical protein
MAPGVYWSCRQPGKATARRDRILAALIGVVATAWTRDPYIEMVLSEDKSARHSTVCRMMEQ